MIYAILDKTGNCINKINWDGETSWAPPEGCTAVLDEENKYQIYSPSSADNSNVADVPVKTPEQILSELSPEQIQALITLLSNSINSTDSSNTQTNTQIDAQAEVIQ